jgi:hypothetical protein
VVPHYLLSVHQEQTPPLLPVEPAPPVPEVESQHAEVSSPSLVFPPQKGDASYLLPAEPSLETLAMGEAQAIAGPSLSPGYLLRSEIVVQEGEGGMCNSLESLMDVHEAVGADSIQPRVVSDIEHDSQTESDDATSYTADISVTTDLGNAFDVESVVSTSDGAASTATDSEGADSLSSDSLCESACDEGSPNISDAVGSATEGFQGSDLLDVHLEVECDPECEIDATESPIDTSGPTTIDSSSLSQTAMVRDFLETTQSLYAECGSCTQASANESGLAPSGASQWLLDDLAGVEQATIRGERDAVY